MENPLNNRKIIHVDMDAFYASVEQMDNPSLRGKPIAVGGGETRGVVSAASYEARKFGVRSAMSGYLAKKNCPDLIFVRPRFDRYREISLKIRKIFRNYKEFGISPEVVLIMLFLISVSNISSLFRLLYLNTASATYLGKCFKLT